METKWATLDNESGTATLKQHCFRPMTRRKKYTFEQYQSNVSLCGHVRFTSGEEYVESIETIEAEPVADDACKICLKRLTKLNESQQ